MQRWLFRSTGTKFVQIDLDAMMERARHTGPEGTLEGVPVE